MDFYVIPPVNHLELAELGERFFCLAQLYKKHSNYREFFKQKVIEGKFVTLDNGVGDGDFISQDELFDIMVDLQPSEVIPLDVLYNGPQTVQNTFDFYQRLRKINLQDQIDILSVPQGNTFQEWIECYICLSKLTFVKTIGMSKLSIPWVVSRSRGDQNIGRDRNVMYDFLIHTNLLSKPLHLLGAGEPTEYAHYQDSPYVRSTDSCFTVLSAINGIKFDKNYKRIPTPRNYFDVKMNLGQIELAKENIAIFRSLLNLK